eukprot:COSAG01_NODE_6208_length_3794_cov_2.218133_2_plen_124_part_00
MPPPLHPPWPAGLLPHLRSRNKKAQHALRAQCAALSDQLSDEQRDTLELNLQRWSELSDDYEARRPLLTCVVPLRSQAACSRPSTIASASASASCLDRWSIFSPRTRPTDQANTQRGACLFAS